jgi:UDP-N-acetyl-D-mannosaminuronic acid transferase (WecB/TagA/CpsF family)
MPKIGISISVRSLEYLDSHTDNRSAFIEELVEAQRKKDFQKELEDDYAELEKDPEFQASVEAWDCVAGDGIDDEDI